MEFTSFPRSPANNNTSSTNNRTEDLITLRDENVMTALCGLKIVETSQENVHDLEDEVEESETNELSVVFVQQEVAESSTVQSPDVTSEVFDNSVYINSTEEFIVGADSNDTIETERSTVPELIDTNLGKTLLLNKQSTQVLNEKYFQFFKNRNLHKEVYIEVHCCYYCKKYVDTLMQFFFLFQFQSIFT